MNKSIDEMRVSVRLWALRGRFSCVSALVNIWLLSAQISFCKRGKMILVTRRRVSAGRRECVSSLNAAIVLGKSPAKSKQSCCFIKLGMPRITPFATQTPHKYSHFHLFQFTTAEMSLLRGQVDWRNARFRPPVSAERAFFVRFRACL